MAEVNISIGIPLPPIITFTMAPEVRLYLNNEFLFLQASQDRQVAQSHTCPHSYR